jgi:hypothetical protein
MSLRLVVDSVVPTPPRKPHRRDFSKLDEGRNALAAGKVALRFVTFCSLT